ncbi:MAG: chromate efflux transporter, partial [Parvibaculaceae bacterium]
MNPSKVPFREALATWAKIGCLSFGGPAGQIAMMHRTLVEEKKWLSEERYLTALNFCMLLPGPEAMQLATYAGWSLHGWRGGLAAGLLFVLPGALVVLILSMIYAGFGDVPLVTALFYGVKAAVLAIVIEALVRIARRALRLTNDWLIAGLAFLALYLFDLPFPLVIAVAALIGFLRTRAAPVSHESAPVDWRSSLATAVLWLALWLGPLALLAAAYGPDHVFAATALFFSKLAVVTFGGAYAVLSYMAQQAVDVYGWLEPREMIDGLGLAETTPGPLILVTEFVGYLAGYREAGGVWGGLATAAITLWMTFVPCFLWIMVGAPYVAKLESMPRLQSALAGITAAVVGVILNLSIWFGL